MRQFLYIAIAAITMMGCAVEHGQETTDQAPEQQLPTAPEHVGLCVEVDNQVDFQSTPVNGITGEYTRVKNNCPFPVELENVRTESGFSDGILDYEVLTNSNGVVIQPSTDFRMFIRFAPQHHSTMENLGSGRHGWLKADLISHHPDMGDSEAEVFLSGITIPGPTPTARMSVTTHVNGHKVDLVNDPQPIPLDSVVWVDAIMSEDGESMYAGVSKMDVEWMVMEHIDSGNDPQIPLVTPSSINDASIKAVQCGTFRIILQVTNKYQISDSVAVPVTWACPGDE